MAHQSTAQSIGAPLVGQWCDVGKPPAGTEKESTAEVGPLPGASICKPWGGAGQGSAVCAVCVAYSADKPAGPWGHQQSSFEAARVQAWTCMFWPSQRLLHAPPSRAPKQSSKQSRRGAAVVRGLHRSSHTGKGWFASWTAGHLILLFTSPQILLARPGSTASASQRRRAVSARGWTARESAPG